MLYQWYEAQQAAIRPARIVADSYRLAMNNPFNPLAHTALGRRTAAACEVFERSTRRYEKPTFGLAETLIEGERVAVTERVVWHRPFCDLIHFERARKGGPPQPRVLLVAPMSGHYATLLRGTVETLLPHHEVFITDWKNASDVPAHAGAFGLDAYIAYVRDMLHAFGGDVHVVAVCQPSVPVLAAVSLMERAGDPNVPTTLAMMGGPVDTRVSPTVVNTLAEQRGIGWFQRNVIAQVPWPARGAGRRVYPGFLQLSGFMTMNLDRHLTAHKDLFMHLVKGDGDSAAKHRTFYDEYLAVMDLTAEFFLETVERVFIDHALARGALDHAGERVDPGAIHRVPLMTVEGEKDDITGLGQCRAALTLATGLDDEHKHHYTCPGVGHYGLFNGRRFRQDIALRLMRFMRRYDRRSCEDRATKKETFALSVVAGTSPAKRKPAPVRSVTAAAPQASARRKRAR